MDSRRDKYRNNIKNKGILISVFSIILILIVSLFISNYLASLIYKQSMVSVSDKIVHKNSENHKSDGPIRKNEIKDTEKVVKYEDSLLENNLVLLQGGVFTDLENAEEFRDKIKYKTLASIVNDGRYERIILGISNKSNYADTTKILKENGIQFVKQLYKIPISVKYNSEILKILDLFIEFVSDNSESLLKGEFDTVKLKEQVSKINVDFGKEGSKKIFDDLRELILELDDKSDTESIESVLDFVYANFKQYKVWN